MIVSSGVRLKMWELYTVESSSKDGSWVGLIFTKLTCKLLKYVISLTIRVTSNEAQYEALMIELQLAIGMGVTSFIVRYDSRLVVNKVKINTDLRGKG